MKANHILVYLGVLALLLVVALVGGQIHDESQRVEFGTWVPLAMLVAVFVVRYFFFRRSNFYGRSNQVAGEPERQRSEGGVDVANIPARPLNMRLVLLLVAIAGAVVILSWLCLIYLGSVGGEDSQVTALMGIRIVTSVVPAITALLLSRSASAAWEKKRWVFQLAALSQVALAFVGLMVMPFVALKSWNGYIDFPAYPLKPGFLWLLLPTAAVIFCLTRGGGSKK